jgi:hypothetical protein
MDETYEFITANNLRKVLERLLGTLGLEYEEIRDSGREFVLLGNVHYQGNFYHRVLFFHEDGLFQLKFYIDKNNTIKMVGCYHLKLEMEPFPDEFD